MSYKDSKRDQFQLEPHERRMAAERSGDADSLLKAIARDISRIEDIEDIGKALGFTVAEIQNFIKTNSRHDLITNQGTVSMLREWSERVSPSSLQSELREALMTAKLVRIADTHLPSGSAPSPQLLTQGQVQQCKEELKEHYRNSRSTVTVDPFDFMNHVDFEEIYTNVILIDQRGERQTHIKYEDLLTNDETGHLSKRLLIQGEGGVGKTTLCSKIAWDWSQGRILKDLDMVIVVPLRDVKGDTSIGGIVKNYLNDSNEATTNQIDNYISKHQDNCLLVFDGFDEFNGKRNDDDESSSEVIRILRVEQYKSCKVIVTTRPSSRHEFTMSKHLAHAYTFIAVEGFNEENLTTYIRRFFRVGQKDAFAESLISFMHENDIIQSNIAPFPIYCAMLCLMWKDFNEEKRKEMTKIQTFSGIFQEMFAFLKDHYASKVCERLYDQETADQLKEAGNAIQDIGEIALNGLLDRKLSFPEEHFRECHEAMEKCCKVGVLTMEKNVIPRNHRRDFSGCVTSLVMTTVSFPHKLFQEYVAGLYIANIYVNDRVKYDLIRPKLIYGCSELRYLLFFASALEEELSLDIIDGVLNRFNDFDALSSVSPGDDPDFDGPSAGYEDYHYHTSDFCADVVFECHTAVAARAVGERLEHFKLSSKKSEHTNAGVVLLAHYNQVRSLSIDGVNCGSTMSRDLAAGMCLGHVLGKVVITNSQFHPNFYKIIREKASSCQIQDLSVSFNNWDDGSHHQSSIAGDLAQWVFTMHSLSEFSLKCPYMDNDFFSRAVASASSCQIQNLGVSFDRWEDDSQHQSSMRDNFGKWVFTMPLLTNFRLKCPYLDEFFFSRAVSSASSCQIKHLYLTLDSWQHGSEHQSSIGVDLAQWVFTMPNLSCFTLKCRCLDDHFFSTVTQSASSCQLTYQPFHDDSNEYSFLEPYPIEEDLVQWKFTMPNLLQLSVECSDLKSSFFKKAAASASSCRIQELDMSFDLWDSNSQQQSSMGGDLAQWVFTIPSLSSFSLKCPYLDDNFFSKAVASTSSCQIQDLKLHLVSCLNGSEDYSSVGGDLAQWVFTMPNLSRFSLSCPYELLDRDFLSTAITSASSCQIQDLTLSVESRDVRSQHYSSIGGNLAQWVLTMPSLSSFSLKCDPSDLDDDFVSTAIASASSCPIKDLKLDFEQTRSPFEIGGNWAQLIFTMSSLSSVSLCCDFVEGDFLSTAIDSAPSCQIQNLTLILGNQMYPKLYAPSMEQDLAQWVCTMPRLSRLSMECLFLTDGVFFSTASKLARSCQV
ncbi:uncharacterized protein [Diadema antillarum]|uniref:uncharacterized protein isoform X2 n=1 Tax=Diadema antillarum TaxID=105358 RepID=UPI003A88D10E